MTTTTTTTTTATTKVYIRFNAESGLFTATLEDNTVLASAKFRRNLFKDKITARLARIGILDNFEIVGTRTPAAKKTAKLEERNFVTKKADAKPGDYIYLFGTQVFKAYEKENGSIGFKKVI